MAKTADFELAIDNWYVDKGRVPVKLRLIRGAGDAGLGSTGPQ